MASPAPAVFLDRDGTLIVEKNYLRDPAEVELLPGAPEALARLRAAGFHLFIVSNQSGIGRGYFTASECDAVNRRLGALLARHGVAFAKIYLAPEAPEMESRGRKPSPAFLFDARDEFGVALADSYMIGDKRIDLECGWNAGVRASLLVRTGYGKATERELPPGRAVVVDDLRGAADWILAHQGETAGAPGKPPCETA